MNLPTETLSLESEVTPASVTSGGVGSGALFGWIDCRTRLPEIGEAVFLIDPAYGPMIGARGWAEDGWLWGTSSGAVWHNGQRWDCDCHQDADYQPTHWHALPALPNSKITVTDKQ
jgi:hypothetical protein